MLVVASKIKKIGKDNKKRISKEFLETLSRVVYAIVEKSIKSSKKLTLKGEDIEIG